MAQSPRYYREQQLRYDLRSVLNNPLADVSEVAAAEAAIQQKLCSQDMAYQNYQAQLTNQFLKQLGGL